MTVHQLRHPRSLAHVLIDIAQADRRCSLHWGDEIEGELLDQLEALRSEARSMIEELTGCEWESVARSQPVTGDCLTAPSPLGKPEPAIFVAVSASCAGLYR
jgi:hypothetical protein